MFLLRCDLWEEGFNIGKICDEDFTPLRGCLVRGGSEEVVIVSFGT